MNPVRPVRVGPAGPDRAQADRTFERRTGLGPRYYYICIPYQNKRGSFAPTKLNVHSEIVHCWAFSSLKIQQGVWGGAWGRHNSVQRYQTSETQPQLNVHGTSVGPRHPIHGTWRAISSAERALPFQEPRCGEQSVERSRTRRQMEPTLKYRLFRTK